jgi:hypothetical protein
MSEAHDRPDVPENSGDEDRLPLESEEPVREPRDESAPKNRRSVRRQS